MGNWANMANVTQSELAVLAGAVILLFVAPALLSWTDERRRRRARRAAIAMDPGAVATGVESPPPASDEPFGEAPEASAPPVDANSAPPAALVSEVPTGAAPAVGVDHDPLSPGVTDPQSNSVSAPTPTTSTELLPLSGIVRHRFRLDDLHVAQLIDWPPAAIRHDPERSRLRQEAERAATEYAANLHAVIIASPYPARSHCLGAADCDAAELRLSFLLFPVLWPVSQNQAVAQAVFHIERTTGNIRGWVDALRPPELSEENRREIREAGGEV